MGILVIYLLLMIVTYLSCRNPSLGLVTKASGYKVVGQEGSSKVMLHAPGSARKCEGIDLHTPKGNSHFGSWSLGGFPNVQRAIAGAKTQWIEEFFISKILKFRCQKWARMIHLDI